MWCSRLDRGDKEALAGVWGLEHLHPTTQGPKAREGSGRQRFLPSSPPVLSITPCRLRDRILSERRVTTKTSSSPSPRMGQLHDLGLAWVSAVVWGAPQPHPPANPTAHTATAGRSSSLGPDAQWGSRRRSSGRNKASEG